MHLLSIYGKGGSPVAADLQGMLLFRALPCSIQADCWPSVIGPATTRVSRETWIGARRR